MLPEQQHRQSEGVSYFGDNMSVGRKIVDITGKRFGKLVVLELYESGLHKACKWLCQCDCGNTKIINGGHIKYGGVTSCGCNVRLKHGEFNFRNVYKRYKKGAYSRNLSWNLNEEQFRNLTKQNCFYCGNPPSNVEKRRRAYGEYVYSGIDRVNNDVGYSPENCVPCCGTCNWMKAGLTQSKFIEHIMKISTNQK